MISYWMCCLKAAFCVRNIRLSQEVGGQKEAELLSATRTENVDNTADRGPVQGAETQVESSERYSV